MRVKYSNRALFDSSGDVEKNDTYRKYFMDYFQSKLDQFKIRSMYDQDSSTNLWYPEEPQQVGDLHGSDGGGGAHNAGDHFANSRRIARVLRVVDVAY